METNVPVSAQNVVPDVTRRSTHFHPGIWGDYFLAYASDNTEIDALVQQQNHQQLKEVVKKMLGTTADHKTSQQLMNLIDAIERLGVSYHFETEIDAALEYIFDACHECDYKEDDDLFTTALRFRLLRQHGHNVFCDDM